MRDPDLIVIGGGAAGLGAARAAARRGARTVLVSDGQPGGDCTFHGCVPSKTLIEAANRGVPFGDATQRLHDVVARIAATENAESLRAEGVDVVLGKAAFTAPGKVTVEGTTMPAKRAVVATGSRPAVPAVPGLSGSAYLTNETIFDLTDRPASLVVLGGGPIGCELAQAFARFGTAVTLVEADARLLPRQEAQASDVVGEVLACDGVDVRTGTRVTGAARARSGVRVSLSDATTVEAERLLVATGRVPISDELGLAAAGVECHEDGRVVTDQYLATTTRGVYAAGDVTGRLPFTHAAYEMGRLAAANSLRRRRSRYRPEPTPWVTFTTPEVAQVGVTEDAAGAGARVAYLPMAEVDRALAAGSTDGFIKLVAGPRRLLRGTGGGRVLGATIVAERAGEMIHEPALAMATHMFTGRLAAATHAYPTWSQGVQLTAAQFFMTTGGRRAHPARNRPR
ncbi:FAD-dependent oxidoreductase [Actinobacteria bacterium YIM 96077]|uniref:NAD(P)/FAD-dependent oxidoreductase n=1 Tax=Phytoactinopolyspora halophila TaxID=1981511 RepID=A0A329QZ53_9ACTN|nr:FAD-dependent oxidoreductase [Actinobacteria bacterium YIM 96077]RAW17694.1 NAD(P)/FAD-dependent oxidoreductase [Phytoactinopolyspora halophila]